MIGRECRLVPKRSRTSRNAYLQADVRLTRLFRNECRSEWYFTWKKSVAASKQTIRRVASASIATLCSFQAAFQWSGPLYNRRLCVISHFSRRKFLRLSFNEKPRSRLTLEIRRIDRWIERSLWPCRNWILFFKTRRFTCNANSAVNFELSAY